MCLVTVFNPNPCLKRFHFFLNQGMSLTLRGIRKVPPLRPSEDFVDLTVWFSVD